MAEPVFGRSDALVGFAATSAALLIALALFPAEPSPEGALFVPAVVRTAVCQRLLHRPGAVAQVEPAAVNAQDAGDATHDVFVRRSTYHRRLPARVGSRSST